MEETTNLANEGKTSATMTTTRTTGENQNLPESTQTTFPSATSPAHKSIACATLNTDSSTNTTSTAIATATASGNDADDVTSTTATTVSTTTNSSSNASDDDNNNNKHKNPRGRGRGRESPTTRERRLQRDRQLARARRDRRLKLEEVFCMKIDEMRRQNTLLRQRNQALLNELVLLGDQVSRDTWVGPWPGMLSANNVNERGGTHTANANVSAAGQYQAFANANAGGSSLQQQFSTSNVAAKGNRHK